MLNTTANHTREVELSPEDLLLGSLTAMLSQIDGKFSVSAEHFRNAHRALEALPLSTSEFARTTANLRNAESYLRQGEAGAARYELVSLHRHSADLLTAPTFVPRRRLRRLLSPGASGSLAARDLRSSR